MVECVWRVLGSKVMAWRCESWRRLDHRLALTSNSNANARCLPELRSTVAIPFNVLDPHVLYSNRSLNDSLEI